MDRLIIFGESGISLSNLYISFAAFLLACDLEDYARNPSGKKLLVGALLMPIWLVVRKLI